MTRAQGKHREFSLNQSMATLLWFSTRTCHLQFNTLPFPENEILPFSARTPDLHFNALIPPTTKAAIFSQDFIFVVWHSTLPQKMKSCHFQPEVQIFSLMFTSCWKLNVTIFSQICSLIFPSVNEKLPFSARTSHLQCKTSSSPHPIKIAIFSQDFSLTLYSLSQWKVAIFPSDGSVQFMYQGVLHMYHLPLVASQSQTCMDTSSYWNPRWPAVTVYDNKVTTRK